MKKLLSAVAAVVGLSALLYAVGLNGLIINQPGLAYNARYTFNLQNADVNSITANATYSSAAYTSGSFGTGQVSTGSVTIADNTKLAAASATNNIVVTSVSGACGDAIVVTKLNQPGAFVFQACRDWGYKATTALTAASIQAALARDTDFASIVSGSTVYSTSTTPGSNTNIIGITTNSPGTLTVAHAAFTGGLNPSVVTVNGYAFKAGVQYAIGGSASASATNLANAINAKAVLTGQVLASPSSAIVSLQSKAPGAAWNFSLKTSNTAAVSVLHPTMIGGATPAWALGGNNVTVPAHGYTLALPLLYSTGSGSPAISGLTTQTTYYAIPVDANTIQLASSSGNAQAGTAITLASSSTLTAAKTYTLAPLSWNAGAAGFDWEVSNDNASWTRVSVASVTYSDTGVPGSISWSMTPTQLNSKYLSLNVTGPTAGGLGLQVTANGIYTY